MSLDIDVGIMERILILHSAIAPGDESKYCTTVIYDINFGAEGGSYLNRAHYSIIMIGSTMMLKL